MEAQGDFEAPIAEKKGEFNEYLMKKWVVRRVMLHHFCR